MTDPLLIDTFGRFGLAALLGFAIGLERSVGLGTGENSHAGVRDFVLFALLGAVSAFVASEYDSVALLMAGFGGMLLLLFSGFWSDFLRNRNTPAGITTEGAAILTFFLGVLVVEGAMAIAIALAIVILAVLSQAGPIGSFSKNVKRFELDAALKLLVISFVVLPVLPHSSLDAIMSLPMGEVSKVKQSKQLLKVQLADGVLYERGDELGIYSERGRSLGRVTVLRASDFEISARYSGEAMDRIHPGVQLRAEFGPSALAVMLSAVRPYYVWLIVIMVSFISFVGYFLVKVFGNRAGIGLTGLVGGLASSTATTLSFARRSVETPALNRHFAVAVLLASTVMFPRLLIQVGVVNQALMTRMLVPVMVMAVTGLAVVVWYYRQSRSDDNADNGRLTLSNPFSLKAALTFALVFATILMVTRLAITYLGEDWLPLVSLVSGLTDADAIAFSVSAAQRDGLISLDWAAFNAVLGAVANTLMKLALVFTLADRGLFNKLLVPVLIIVASGLLAAFLYYDFSTPTPAG